MDLHRPLSVILTGSPGTGKSSLLAELKRRGHPVYHEIAREVILESQSKGSSLTPWEDLPGFTQDVMSKGVERFVDLPKDTLTFMDRGLPDSIAYLHWGKQDVLSRWRLWTQQYRYANTVFICPPWEDIYSSDNQRKESFSESLEIHKHMVNTYQELQYSLISLPLTSVEERANFIEEELSK